MNSFIVFNSVNSTLQTLSLGDMRGGNLIGDKGATALADALMYVTITPPEMFLHFVYIFFLIMKVCLCPICSQNKTLQILGLSDNKIGDAGAASIGDALAYVTLTL